MENLQEIKALFDLINTFNVAIPDGVEESLEVNGTKIALNKKDGVINISVTSNNENINETFDDSRIKEVIRKYKERIEELDDCLFVDVVEDMGKSFDIREFNCLLDKDSYTEEEALEIADKIDVSIDIIRKHLENKINKLVNVYNRFQ